MLEQASPMRDGLLYYDIMQIHWLDAIVLVIFAVYLLDGLQRGFVVSVLDLAGLVVGLLAALRFYERATPWIVDLVGVSDGLARPLAFVALWLLAGAAFSLATRVLLGGVLGKGTISLADRVLALVPSAFRGVLVVALVLALFAALPLPQPLRDAAYTAPMTRQILEESRYLQQQIKGVVGGAVDEAVDFLTVRPRSDQTVRLRATVAEPTIDAAAERAMLELVNQERTSRGLPPLQPDPTLQAAARGHAVDMWRQGYFAHRGADGRTPAQRMQAAGATFGTAGENLALAPNVETAHRGLMESPGHRANILNPGFRRVGIGVADGGLHGKIFVQNFAD
jgi:uncharacterized protein YkwD